MTGSTRYAVLAGGGTAGHVLPLLALARAVAERGHDPGSIEIMGSSRGQDVQALEAAGFPFTLLPGRGIRRSLAPADLASNGAAVVDAGRAVWRTLRLFRRWRPSVVATAGGYASFPAGFAAMVWRVPLVLVNSDAVPGLVHRLLSRPAAACAVAFPGTPLPRTVVTGTPVRAEIGKVDRSPAGRQQALETLGVPAGRRLIVAFGGSLGAKRINEAVRGLATRWADRDDLALYHVVGRRQWEQDQQRRTPLAPEGAAPDASSTGNARSAAGASSPGLWYRVVPFEDRMPLLYAAADLVVSRAGAMTVGELALTGVPAILVPLPGAPDDHQTENARVLVRVGAAELLADRECSTDALAGRLEGLLSDQDRLTSMAGAAAGLGRADAAQRVAEVVTDHAR